MLETRSHSRQGTTSQVIDTTTVPIVSQADRRYETKSDATGDNSGLPEVREGTGSQSTASGTRAYGFTYSDDLGPSNDHGCHLLVEASSGPLRYRLASKRLSAKVMKKFHVNVAESIQPTKVTVVCRGKPLDTKPITPATEKLTFTVNGRPLSTDK